MIKFRANTVTGGLDAMTEFRAILAASALFFVLTVLGVESRAQVTFLTDKDEYIANHPYQLVQTFADGNVAPGVFQFCSIVVNTQTSDDCFQPGDILPGLEFISNPPGLDLELVGVNASGFGNPRKALGRQTDSMTEFIQIEFLGGGVHAAGIVPGGFDGSPPFTGTFLFRVYGLGDVLIAETSFPVTGLFDTFIGFDSTLPVERVTISDQAGNATFEAVDEVRFDRIVNPIPALSEWGMISAALGFGLVGLWFALRKRKAQAD